MPNPKSIGEVSEAVVLAHLVKAGAVVLLPFGNNQRYDLVIDHGDGRFERVQVKTARLRNGCVNFKTASVNGFTGKRTSYVAGADSIIAYCPDNDRLYKVMVTDCGTSMVSLRVDPPRGGQSASVRNADDYEMRVVVPSG